MRHTNPKKPSMTLDVDPSGVRGGGILGFLTKKRIALTFVLFVLIFGGLYSTTFYPSILGLLDNSTDELTTSIDDLGSSFGELELKFGVLESDILELRSNFASVSSHSHNLSDIDSSDIDSRFDSRFADLESRLTSLASELSSLSVSVSSLPTSVQLYASTIDSPSPLPSPDFNQELLDLSERVDLNDSTARHYLGILFAHRLRDRVDSGQPFDVSLVRPFFDSPALDRLSVYGSSGVPSLTTLRLEFDDLRSDIEVMLSSDDSDAGLFGRLASGVIRVRSLSPSEGSVIFRITSALDSGRLDDVLSLESELPVPVRDVMSVWFSRVLVRRSADAYTSEIIDLATRGS